MGGEALISADQAYTELKGGTADITDIQSMIMPAQFPINQFTRKLFYGSKDMIKVMNNYVQLEKEFPDYAKEWGAFKTLTIQATGLMDIHSINPVRKLDDFKGLKVRIIGDWLKSALTASGATPMAIPATDLYISLQKGIVDSYLHSATTLKSYKTAEITKYSTTMGLCDGCAVRTCMNWASFNNLPADIQKLINDSLPQLMIDFADAGNKSPKGGYDYALSLGPHEIMALPQADLDKFYALAEQEARDAAKVLDSKGMPATQMLERTRQLIAAQ
jgi:TRAP-type C4-dicarboxylate transport system substrate-binding protein